MSDSIHAVETEVLDPTLRSLEVVGEPSAPNMLITEPLSFGGKLNDQVNTVAHAAADVAIRAGDRTLDVVGRTVGRMLRSRPVIGTAASLTVLGGVQTIAEATPCMVGGRPVDCGDVNGPGTPSEPPEVIPAPITGEGYSGATKLGGVTYRGDRDFEGEMNADLSGVRLNQPILDSKMMTQTGKGYWLVGRDGGVFAFGDAGFHGSTGGMRLNKPIVGMAPTPSEQGYWLVASDGGIFSFGDANFHGSTGSTALNQPVVGMASTESGNGYWTVASDGGIFAFGDAQFKGSTGGQRLNRPIVSMSATNKGDGYWLAASDGGIFNYGDAGFYGSTGGMTLNRPVVDMAPHHSDEGYYLVAGDGGVFALGRAATDGWQGSLRTPDTISGVDSVVSIDALPPIEPAEEEPEEPPVPPTTIVGTPPTMTRR